MGIVYQKNKKTGITYVYNNQAYWDKEKQQSRAKRTLIGKLDPDTGEILPTRSYRKDTEQKQNILKKSGPISISKIRRDFYGSCYLLDQVGKITEVEADLKACFPDRYRMILSIAYYLILEENNS
ncbi:MAG: transposase, partial [Mesotoga sp.]|nr:transposase [Mesotoga sp.]